MESIKLTIVDILPDGTHRLQSQLMVGRTSADFILEPNGALKCWGNGKNGFDFYKYDGKYKIIKQNTKL